MKYLTNYIGDKVQIVILIVAKCMILYMPDLTQSVTKDDYRTIEINKCTTISFSRRLRHVSATYYNNDLKNLSFSTRENP